MAALNSAQWTNWQTASGSPPRPAPATTTAVAASGIPSPGTYNYQTLTLSHAGEGNQQVSIFVTVDAPTTLSNAPYGQWMRIRAVGTTTLPGSAEASMVPQDSELRRMSFFTNRDTGQAITTPQASRYVEAIARRNGSSHAIILKDQITMKPCCDMPASRLSTTHRI